MKFLLALALATLTDAFLGRSAVRVQQRRNVAAPMMALPIDCKGKVAFVSGMADPNGYGWAITKALAEAGATIIVGVWPPMLRIFEMNLKNGKFDDDMRLPDGSMMKIEKIYAQDAVFDTPEDVPADIASNKRYAGLDGFTISEVAAKVKADYGTIDILVHSIANGPEVTKPLLEVSRAGYLAASSASAYSMVSLVQRFGPFMNPGGSVISLSYFAAEKTIPGYGGGMSSAKAQLESDTRTLAFEAGRKYGIRVNTLSAGPLKSRAATAISAKGQKAFIDFAIDYSKARARARVSSPLPAARSLSAAPPISHRERSRASAGERADGAGPVQRRRRRRGVLPSFSARARHHGRHALRRQRPPLDWHGRRLELDDGEPRRRAVRAAGRAALEANVARIDMSSARTMGGASATTWTPRDSFERPFGSDVNSSFARSARRPRPWSRAAPPR